MTRSTGYAITLITIVALAGGCVSQLFVRVDAGRFWLHHAEHHFAGVNFWQAVYLAAPAPIGNRRRLLRELDLLQSLGVSNIRILAAFEGPDTEPYRVTPSMMTSPGIYNDAVLDGLDYLVDQLHRRNMYTVVALTNFWEWSGGMAQYVSWSDGSNIPYPETHDWRVFCDYAKRFYECRPCQSRFRDHIMTIIERINRYTNRRYRDEPAIFAWELANEPRYYPKRWIDDTAAFIKSLDPNHLVTTGSEGEVGGDFRITHAGPNIDYTTIHIWPQNWGWFDPHDPSTFAKAQTKALEYFRKHEQQSCAMGKPMVVEEFGLARDFEPKHDCYDPQSPTTLRDQFFQSTYDAIEQSMQMDGSAAGSNFWVWTGMDERQSERIGDPPHETPGWYSVYATDRSTLETLQRHADRLARAPHDH